MVVCGTVLVVAWFLAIGRLGDADVVCEMVAGWTFGVLGTTVFELGVLGTI